MSTMTGQSALLNVEEEPRLGLEPATTLLQPTGALIVLDKALNLRIALIVPVQVNSFWTFQLVIKHNIKIS